MVCTRCRTRSAADGQQWCSPCKNDRRREVREGAPRRRQVRQDKGITVPDSVKHDLAELAREMGIIN